MTVSNQKYAMYFPDFQKNYNDSTEPNLFSENAICHTENLLAKTHESMDGLLGLVIQVNRTHQLEKQISLLEEGIDVSVEEAKKQFDLQLAAEAERLKIKLESDKKDLNIQIQKINIAAKEKSAEFSLSFEEVMKSEELFQKLIKNEFSTIKIYQQFVNKLPDNFQKDRRYIIYCDIQKKALDQINRYLAEIV
jgi:hypothetical protein